VKAAQEKRRIEEEKRRAEHEACLRQRAVEEEQRRLAELECARKQAIRDRKDELIGILEQWDGAKQVKAFLQEMESLLQAANPEDRVLLINRLQEAKGFLWMVEPLQLLRKWRTPGER